jgi:Acetyltransferase (GNAT) domain
MSDKDLYRKLCVQGNSLPLFMQPWWLDEVCGAWGAAIVKKGDHITGAWAYPLERKMGTALMRTPLLTPYLGPHVFYPPDVKGSNRDSFEHETIAALLKKVPKAAVWHLAIEPGIKQVGLFKQHKLRAQVQQTFLLELKEDEATLFANMKEATRRNVRIAEKEVTISHSPEHLKDLYRFQKQTLGRKRKKIPYTLDDLRRIMQACDEHDACSLWVARSGGKVQAIVWQVWDNNCSYYFMGGQNPDTNSYRAMSLLLWHTIREAKRRGHTHFDLEGSMDEGVERFFRNFGGERALYVILHRNDSLLWRLKKMVLG